jgi:hypothetical protein
VKLKLLQLNAAPLATSSSLISSLYFIVIESLTGVEGSAESSNTRALHSDRFDRGKALVDRSIDCCCLEDTHKVGIMLKNTRLASTEPKNNNIALFFSTNDRADNPSIVTM